MRLFFFVFLILSSTFQIKSQIAWEWVQSEYSTGSSGAFDIVVDSLDNIYVSGYFSGEIQFRDSIYEAVSNADIFVAKYDNNGVPLWMKNIGKFDSSYGSSIILDDSLNIYVTGSYSSYATLIIKLNQQGERVWRRFLDNDFPFDCKGKTIAISGNKICFVSSDYVHVYTTSGNELAHLKIDVQSVSANFREDQFLIASQNCILAVDSNLNIIKSYTMHQGVERINSIALKDTFIYFTGMYNEHIEFNHTYTGEEYSFDGYNNMVVAKVDSNNLIHWVNSGGGDNTDMGNSILITENDQVFVTGYYRNAAVFDTIEVGRLGLFNEIFVAQYDNSDGKLLDFIYASGSRDDDIAYGIAEGHNNQLFVAGAIVPVEGVNFGDFIFNGISGNTDYFIAKIKKAETRAKLKGKVMMDGSPSYSEVKLYRYNIDSTAQLIYDYRTGSDGEFEVSLTKKGTYYLKAHYNYNNFVSSYYQNTFHWEYATPFIINSDTTINNLLLNLIKLPALTGENIIEGYVFEEDSLPSRFVDMFIVDNNNSPISYARTDSSGNYSFNNIPDGQYKIYLDTLGVYMKSYHTVNVGSYNSKMAANTLKLKALSASTLYSNNNYLIKDGMAIALDFIEQCTDSYDTISAMVCESYLSPSENHTWIESGIYNDTIPNTAGCDSIITVELIVQENTYSSLSVTSCNTYISPSGKIWSSTGEYIDTIPNANGCDSIIRLDVVIESNFNIYKDSTICIGDSVYLEGNYQKEEGIYTDTIFCQEGCDSIIITNLINIDCTVDNHNYELGDLKVYPNPTNGYVTIPLIKRYENIVVQVYNQLGECIQNKEFKNTDEIIIELDGPQGLYFVGVLSSSGILDLIKVVKN